MGAEFIAEAQSTQHWIQMTTEAVCLELRHWTLTPVVTLAPDSSSGRLGIHLPKSRLFGRNLLTPGDQKRFANTSQTVAQLWWQLWLVFAKARRQNKVRKLYFFDMHF
jgi:hypothetical protein